jgi:hypothetical protein
VGVAGTFERGWSGRSDWSRRDLLKDGGSNVRRVSVQERRLDKERGGDGLGYVISIHPGQSLSFASGHIRIWGSSWFIETYRNLPMPCWLMLVDNGQIAIHDLDSESSTPEILNDLLLLDAAGCRLQAAGWQPRQGVPPALCLDSGVLSIPNLSQSSRCMDPSFIPDDHMLKRVQTPKPQISLTSFAFGQIRR